VTLNANESININGENTGLEYSWKIGNSKYSSAATVTHRFDELGCFPVKLTVQSKDNGKTSSMQIMIQVENALPQLTLLGINVQDSGADPLIIDVSALGANDPDGVIQSYLWYYYTDIDTQPQDFRSSSSSSTTFVIPKITGNYYFVVILKDNNEARITSEEAT
jgi:PKD repeat protein